MIIKAPLLRKPGAPLGIIPFVVPDWPNPAIYARSIERILRYDPVSWEIAVPSKEWSPRTGSVISGALGATNAKLEDVVASAAGTRPNVAVVYRGLASQLGREGTLELLRGSFDQVMLEWDDPNFDSWGQACESRGMGLLRTVDASLLTKAATKDLCETISHGAILYMSWASVTGGATCPMDILREAVDEVRTLRPDVYIMTGFGVRNAAQVRRLASIESLDAAAVGTALLERFISGATAVEEFFASLVAAGGAPIG